MKIIGLCGAQRSGKDTFAKFLCTRFPEHFTHYSFANVLKEECSTLIPKEELGWNGVDWSGPKTEAGRQLLQKQGAGKRVENISYWVDKFDERVKSFNTSYVIASDVRHVNEIEYILGNNGGIVYVCNRKAEYEFFKSYKIKYEGHESEIQWRMWLACNPYKHLTIDNEGSLKDFECGILEFINRYHILSKVHDDVKGCRYILNKKATVLKRFEI